MADRRRHKPKRGNDASAKSSVQKKWMIGAVIGVLVLVCIGGTVAWQLIKNAAKPEDTVEKYFTLMNQGGYAEAYSLLSEETKERVTKEEFTERIGNIYKGMEAQNFRATVQGEAEYAEGKKKAVVTYSIVMDSLADEISFENKMDLVKEQRQYLIEWDSTDIFPTLQDDYKVQIQTKGATRGAILDRNGQMLAGQGVVDEVGVVPGKLGDDRAGSIQKMAETLDMTKESIEEKLGASYVKDDSFVPLRKLAKGNTEMEEKLLSIPGIMINDREERVYPLGAAAGQLTGYVQAVTAEDLEELAEKGYHENSVIGKSGLERTFEEELKPVDGYSIDIVTEDGQAIESLALKPAENGKDIHVTIDATVQTEAYTQFAPDPGTVAAMNPKTGEVLALVSTPGLDPNEFVLGMSNTRWDELNNDTNKPLTNRFNTSWVPGSTFKAITAAIGVDTGKTQPDVNMGYVGLSWQKDASWGDYNVTTLTDYGSQVNLENALVYSDNIYFARAALDIGADTLIDKFKAMGFEEEMPFELVLSQSTYDDDGKIDSDIQLADTGYGQGQLLVNPVHMLSMYSIFVNSGSMIQPTILYKEQPEVKMWKENVVSAETAETVKNGLIQVIENPAGTGAIAKVDGVLMLGKTGTAEIKESQDDTKGIERGWFACETTEDIEKPIAVVGMIEDVKGKGGSNYVTEKVGAIVRAYEH